MTTLSCYVACIVGLLADPADLMSKFENRLPFIIVQEIKGETRMSHITDFWKKHRDDVFSILVAFKNTFTRK